MVNMNEVQLKNLVFTPEKCGLLDRRSLDMEKQISIGKAYCFVPEIGHIQSVKVRLRDQIKETKITMTVGYL